MLERARAAQPMEGTIEDKCTAVHTALMDAAHTLLGRVNERQPNWFQESVDELRLKLMDRNDACTKWLASIKRIWCS